LTQETKKRPENYERANLLFLLLQMFLQNFNKTIAPLCALLNGAGKILIFDF
jgi:hypothetical protein